MIWIKGITSLIVLLLHAENMLFHKVKLHQEETDESKDKWIDTHKIEIAVYLILASHAFFAYRFVFSNLYSPVFWVGTIIFLFGYGLRTWSYRILGRFFTFEIGIRNEHKIIEVGPYRFIRHPSYTGYILMILGIGLSFHSLIYLFGGVVGCFVFFVVRIHNEEQMMAEHFEDEWQEYKRKTSALIPFIF